MSKQKFYYEIISYRRIGYDSENKNETLVDKGYFQTKSIQAAKAMLTRKCKSLKLFLHEKDLSRQRQALTGESLRWKSWSPPVDFLSDAGDKRIFVTRPSESLYGRQASHQSVLWLYWSGEKK